MTILTTLLKRNAKFLWQGKHCKSSVDHLYLTSTKRNLAISISCTNDSQFPAQRCCDFMVNGRLVQKQKDKRAFSTDLPSDEVDLDYLDENAETISSEVDTLLKDQEYDNYFRDYCNIPSAGHSVFILQIVEKSRKSRLPKNAGEMKLAENIALVQSIPKWKVADKLIVETNPNVMKGDFLLHRTFNGIMPKVMSTPGVSALFITTNQFSAEQTVMLQKRLGMPVFNRAFIIIQAFKSQARSKDAKVQVALAELPHLKFQFGVSNSARTLRSIYSILRSREKKLKTALLAIGRQKTKLRDSRVRRRIPAVAVIGYTNSGKTSLIKALTGDEDLTPEDRLFATVDVTAHAGHLPNHMTVLYLDTVGFISDLPTRLRDAFTATLNDIKVADLIIHVMDRSHPDYQSQQTDVMESVRNLLSEQNLQTMIHVHNKTDLVERLESEKDVFCISSLTGMGLDVLKKEIQTRVLSNVNYLQKKLKIPLAGEHLSWLQREATVVSMETDSDPECLIVNVYISSGTYQKFLAKFSNRKMSSTKLKSKDYYS